MFELKGTDQVRRLLARVPLVPLLTAGLILFALAEAGFAFQAFTQTGCTWCHVPARATVEHKLTAHKDTRCLDCHRGRTRFYPVELNLKAAHDLWVQLSPFADEDPSRGAVTQGRCLACHAGAVAKPLVRDGLKMRHTEPIEAQMGCRQCHARATHGRSLAAPTLSHSRCSPCHDGRTAGTSCTVCHVAQPDSGALPEIEQAYHTTEVPGLHGMGTASTCTICHARSYCKSCHRVDLPHDPSSFPFVHGSESLSSGDACLRCHSRRYCDDCHKVPMPHPADYLRQHGQQAQKARKTCSGCHVTEDCTSCHAAHTHPELPPAIKKQLGLNEATR